MVMNQEDSNQTKKARKTRVKSAYLFPAYDFGTARRVAERVEKDGAGTLTEETLAIALGASAKSSGFRLRTLSARQFKFLTKHGSTLATTPLAKAIIKPTSEDERANAIIESFLAIPLFNVVANRFKGQPLPQGEAFRNILEREFRIEIDRVAAAERVLMDSAREAGLLQTSGNNLYLVTQTTPVSQPSPFSSTSASEVAGPVSVSPPGAPTSPEGSFLTVSEQDLADFDDREFAQIWEVLGKVIRVRGKRQRAQKEQVTSEEIEEEKE